MSLCRFNLGTTFQPRDHALRGHAILCRSAAVGADAAERQYMRSHAERGNEARQFKAKVLM